MRSSAKAVLEWAAGTGVLAQDGDSPTENALKRHKRALEEVMGARRRTNRVCYGSLTHHLVLDRNRKRGTPSAVCQASRGVVN